MAFLDLDESLAELGYGSALPGRKALFREGLTILGERKRARVTGNPPGRPKGSGRGIDVQKKRARRNKYAERARLKLVLGTFSKALKKRKSLMVAKMILVGRDLYEGSPPRLHLLALVRPGLSSNPAAAQAAAIDLACALRFRGWEIADVAKLLGWSRAFVVLSLRGRGRE